jgi:mannose/cellobiose epimerase-like protein (N-acyl-D-glucosamine 2-epimerase family)
VNRTASGSERVCAAARSPRRVSTTRSLTLAVLFFAFLAGCAVDERRGVPADAQSAVDSVTDDIAAGRDAKVYEEAAEEWRASVSAEENARMLSRVRERLGKVENRALHTGKEQQSASPPLSGHTLELVYQTRFERGPAMERFTLVERGGQWLLAGYKVTSDALR